MPDERSYHMTPEAFRQHGREVVDWIADYYERIESFPVLSESYPGQVRASLPEHPPLEGETFETILKDMDELIIPGITHWQSPNFFAFFPANASGPSILGEMLSAALGVQGMLWTTSPACTELETHVLDWLVEMLGLPHKFRSNGAGRGNSGYRLKRSALCPSGCPGTDDGIPVGPTGCPGAPRSLYLDAGSFLCRKSRENCRVG